MTEPEAVALIAVPAAVGSAVFFGLTGALQHRAARRTGETGTVRFHMIVELLRQPLWLASLGTSALGIVLQWVALSTGPLVLVQPLLVTGLLFAVLFSSAMYRQRPDRVVLLGTVLCGAGLAAFILVASPTPGNDTLELLDVLPLAGGLAVILAVCITVGIRHPGRVRALALATATGVLYGVTAGLTKLAAADLTMGGLAFMFRHWPIYLVLVCGPLGFLLNQNAFRVGVVLAPALAVMIVLDPLVSIGIGMLWLGEAVNGSPAALAGELVALGVLFAGVAILSRRAPQTATSEQVDGGPGAPQSEFTTGQEQEGHGGWPREQQA